MSQSRNFTWVPRTSTTPVLRTSNVYQASRICHYLGMKGSRTKASLASALLTNLTKLYLHETKISNAGLKNLKPFVNLEELDLELTSINDEGLSLLATSCPNLKELSLNQTIVSDEGVVHLLKFASLESLGLEGCTQFTEAGRDRLKAGIPGLKVQCETT